MVTPLSHIASEGPLEANETSITVFLHALEAFDVAGITYAIGGGLAMHYYTGTHRQVKDMDLHILPVDVERSQQALRNCDFKVGTHHAQWLAQAHQGDIQICTIFGQGSWTYPVDEVWMQHGRPGLLWGRPVTYAPPEEIIWSKAFICARYRFDGADIYHLILALGDQLDWNRILSRFGDDFELLFSHLLLFRYTFPSDAGMIPDWVLDQLATRLEDSRRTLPPQMGICRGLLLDGSGTFAVDIEERGYLDVREERWQQRVRETAQQKYH